MSFVENVRRNAVSSPVHRSFSLSKWRDVFGETGTTAACRSLYESGVIVHRILTLIRHEHSLVPRLGDPERHIRYLIGMANRDSVVLRDELQTRLAESTGIFFANELEQYKFRLSGGGEHGVEEISEANGDSLSSAVGTVLRFPYEGDRSREPQNHLEAIGADINICGMYAVVESIWGDCQWNGYGFLGDWERGYSVAPIDEAAANTALIKTVTQYRKSILQLHNSMIIASLWKNTFSLQQKRALMPVKFVREIVKEGKHWRFLLGSLEDPAAETHAIIGFVARDLIMTGYYAELLSERPKELRGASVSELFYAWLVIRSLAAASGQRYKQSDVYTPNTLLASSPVFSKISIVRLISEATGLTPKIVDGIICFLVFTGARSQTLWTQPLVCIARANLVFSVVTTQSAHPTYVFERWLSQLSVQISKKGTPFEAVVRQELASSAKKTYFDNELNVLPSGLAFKPARDGQRNEEIDLIFKFGHLVVIGEIKCTVAPVEPIDFYNNREILAGACAQVKRKSQSVQANEAAFRRTLARHGIDLPLAYEVIELIIVNNSYHVGYEISGVPVVDIKVLVKFFEGDLVELGESVGGGRIEAKHTLSFHSSLQEAEAVFRSYLSVPPQLRIIKKSAKKRKAKVPLRELFPSLPNLHFFLPEVNCQVPLDHKRALRISRASFAAIP